MFLSLAGGLTVLLLSPDMPCSTRGIIAQRFNGSMKSRMTVKVTGRRCWVRLPILGYWLCIQTRRIRRAWRLPGRNQVVRCVVGDGQELEHFRDARVDFLESEYK